MMRLSELVSHIGSSTFPIISLAIFLTVFVAVAIAALRPGARAEQRRARTLPLDDDGGLP
jgi:cbb3-type cytochrome oxidase subunit 3